MSPQVSYVAAASQLAARVPAMARLVAAAGPIHLSRSQETHFAALARAITYQQLAGAAAAAIHGRLLGALDGTVAPETLLALSDEQLRAAGLSGNKAASLRDLAAKVLDGTVVLDPRRLAHQSDEEVVRRLTAVRGIGEWTAQMFLIFQLRRLDVWPVDDYGIRKGWALSHKKKDVPAPKALQAEGDLFRPYRTIAAWYCWRAVDTVLPA